MQGSLGKSVWYMDSGCSKHMTGTKSLLDSYVETDGPTVVFGDDSTGKTEGYGSLTNGLVKFSKVAYVNGLKHNLISISQLCDADYKVILDKHQGTVVNINKEVVLVAPRKRDVYLVDFTPIKTDSETCFFAKAAAEVNWLWHKRMSHVNFKTINSLSKRSLVRGLPPLSFEKDRLCGACEKGKSHRATFKTKHANSIKRCFHLLHMDLFDPVNVQSLRGSKYTLVIVDEYSRYTWTFFLRSKSDAAEEIINFIKRMENLNSIRVKELRSDHGTEFKNHTLESFCADQGIFQNFLSVR